MSDPKYDDDDIPMPDDDDAPPWEVTTAIDEQHEVRHVEPERSAPRLPSPIDERCPTCKAYRGVACDTSKVPAFFDGAHTARMRLVIEGPSSSNDATRRERDEYNQAVRSREKGGGKR